MIFNITPAETCMVAIALTAETNWQIDDFSSCLLNRFLSHASSGAGDISLSDGERYLISECILMVRGSGFAVEGANRDMADRIQILVSTGY